MSSEKKGAPELLHARADFSGKGTERRTWARRVLLRPRTGQKLTRKLS
jgi:hypothetical protein